VVSKAVARMAHRQLAGLFGMWLAGTAFEIQLSRKQQLGGGAMRRMAERGVCCAMVAWHEVMVLRRRQLRALRFWLQRAQARSYNRWKEYRAERVYKTRLLAFAVGRLARRKLAVAFDAWYRGTAADSDRQQVQGQKRAESAAMRMVERGVCSMMAAWHEVTVLRRRQARALKHWIERSLAAAYMRWAEHVTGARVLVRKKTVATQVVSRRIAVRKVCSMMLAWHEVITLRRRHVRALHFWIRKTQHKALHVWRIRRHTLYQSSRSTINSASLNVNGMLVSASEIALMIAALRNIPDLDPTVRALVETQ